MRADRRSAGVLTRHRPLAHDLRMASERNGVSRPLFNGRIGDRGQFARFVRAIASGTRNGITRTRSITWQLRPGVAWRPGSVRILFYHRIADDRDELAVAPERFREQMSFLAEHGYRVVDVVRALQLLDRGDLTERVVALSFDDGYLDVAETALPVLEEHGFGATVFVVTGALDGKTSFQWYTRQPALLSWEDITRLDRESPLRFEPHSVTHPNLITLRDDDARREIVESKRVLETHLGRPALVFCYPLGVFGSRERAFVAAAGYRSAVSCEPGLNDAETDRFALRRTQILRPDGLRDFRAKLEGAHDAPLLLRDVYRRARYGGGSITHE